MKNKSFIGDLGDIQNPAMSFISQASIDRAEGKTPGTEAKGNQPEAVNAFTKEETKSKRVQLLITPSLYEAIKEKAKAAGTSTNNYINYLLKEGVGQ